MANDEQTPKGEPADEAKKNEDPKPEEKKEEPAAEQKPEEKKEDKPAAEEKKEDKPAAEEKKPEEKKPAPAPAKPAAAAAKTGETRRAFVEAVTSPFNIAWAALSAATLGMVLGTVRFLYPNVTSEPPSKVKVGPKSAYEDNEVVDRYKEQNFWIVRHGGKIYALSTTCTHLGCTPNWLDGEEKFKCPCHGSGFKITGVNFEGPAPRPLERWGIYEDTDGQLVVDKSKKFQKELGQWDNPESFVNV
ncbi:MAG: ubiquinol-cytochrome c reductase iron-sulfur subunit [Gemmataceae bacterium]